MASVAERIGAAVIALYSRGVPDFPDSAAWAEMLARIASCNTRLARRLVKSESSAEISLVQELERERSRIARDLHAGAGQPLAGIKLNLELLDGCTEGMPQHARDAFARLQTLTGAALEQVRAVSHRLYPPEWQKLNTDQAIRGMILNSGVMDRFETSIDIRPLPAEPSHFVKVVLYRSAQECLSNIFRHSEATKVGVTLVASGDNVELRISDNGRGLSEAGRDGIGLKAIREHARSAGGTSRIEGRASGTTICIRVPIANEES